MSEILNAASWRRWPLWALCMASSCAFAADEGQLDEIVVTATRLETSLRDTTRAVSVIDKQQIQNATQQLGIDEALASVPGLYMQNRYNFSQDLRVSLRGFGARSSFGIRGIKIIVDGIPETLPDGQAQVDSIDLGSAQRIEVLRGPSSSLYGNASGGVIAIESEIGADEPYVEAGLAAGELGYTRLQLKTGGSTAAVDYMLNLSHQEIDGYRELSA
ncbi:MAG TPA: TonB-dependent receptor plug domain-containing protein, partial [Woeseiaceae bacterium]|nr:TonB-dependent receptor plug domain-containing protein [Woeseiaceae bacterium]